MAGLGGVVEEPLLRLRRRVYDESPQMGGQRLLSERKLAAGLIEFSAGDIETLSVIGLAAGRLLLRPTVPREAARTLEDAERSTEA